MYRIIRVGRVEVGDLKGNQWGQGRPGYPLPSSRWARVWVVIGLSPASRLEGGARSGRGSAVLPHWNRRARTQVDGDQENLATGRSTTPAGLIVIGRELGEVASKRHTVLQIP